MATCKAKALSVLVPSDETSGDYASEVENALSMLKALHDLLIAQREARATALAAPASSFAASGASSSQVNADIAALMDVVAAQRAAKSRMSVDTSTGSSTSGASTSNAATRALSLYKSFMIGSSRPYRPACRPSALRAPPRRLQDRPTVDEEVFMPPFHRDGNEVWLAESSVDDRPRGGCLPLRAHPGRNHHSWLF